MWYEISNASKTSVNTYYEKNHSSTLPKRDSVSSLGEEEQQQSDGDDSSSGKVVIQEQSSFQFEGVRFIPKVVEFNDAFDGKQFLQKIKLQNVGRNPVLIKMGEPSSFVFHMDKHERGVKLLPPGKSIRRTLSYVYHNDDIVQRSQIRVQINGRMIDYPIVVKKASPSIEVYPPELDFKVINMGASAKTLKINIINNGGRGTKFAIDLGRNELDLVVNPPRGTIRAKSHITIYVEMVGLTEGEFYKEMWITTNEKPIRVPIIAEVMRPRLEVYHPNATGDFTLINFPPTFIGTQRLDSIVLRNFSADLTPFVIFAEIGGELKAHKDARKTEAAFRMFALSAEEGRLEPFESRIVTILYKPLGEPMKKGWHHRRQEDAKKNLSNEYLVFFRINRVHCIEKQELDKVEVDQKIDMLPLSQKEVDKRQSIMLSVASVMAISGLGMGLETLGGKVAEQFERLSLQSGMPFPLEDKDVVRLCLHGEACEPDLLIQPNCLEFQNLIIGKSCQKVLQLTNLSQISMKFQFHKSVNIKLKPVEGWLKGGEVTDILVLYTPRFIGNLKFPLKVEVFGRSAAFFEGEKTLVSLRLYEVPASAFISMPTARPRPDINLGITPRITHETGFFPELVTFGSKYPKPYAAILGALEEKSRPMWMIKESRKGQEFENAVIAFPNDRANMFRSRGSRVYRTIFTGNFRYSPPPNPDYAFTTEEMDRRNENYKFWKEYVHSIMDGKELDITSSDSPSEPTIDSTERHNSKILLSKQKKESQLVRQIKKQNLMPKFVLIPLSPMFLCNIRVEPKLIDFAMVAANSSVSEILKLHNTNPFPVSIRFVPGKSGVTLPEGDTRIVPPNMKKLLPIVFKTKDFGRYNGFLDYVINGSHQFKITVSANVVPKTLSICETEHNIEFGLNPSGSAFQFTSRSVSLINNLRSPIEYHWEMQSDAAYVIEPTSGQVPPMVSLMTQIYFMPHPEKSCMAEANLISASGTPLPIKLSYRKYKTNVNFVMSKIELRELPLNLVEIVKPTMRNASYDDVAFEVVHWSPMPGVKISPRQGIIKARSTFDLDVEFQIPVIIDFEFDIKIRTQTGNIFSLKVYGSVVSPAIRIIPMEITMRKISAQSFDVASMCIENIGITPVHILIDLKDYPEYHIYRRKENFWTLDTLEEEGIILPPEKSVKFNIHFEPTDVARYQFYLPITINGILGPPMMQDVNTEYYSYYLKSFEDAYFGYGELTRSADIKTKIPCAIINCTVTGHLLSFSTFDVTFQKSLQNVSEEEDIEITNLQGSPQFICIRTDDVNHASTPFVLRIVGKKVEYHSKSIKIHLKGGEAVTLRARFEPVKAGQYVVEIPVFVKGYKGGYAYNFLYLRGELKKHRILSDVKEIHFPPLPLRVGSEIIFQIHAERYKSPDIISYTIPDLGEDAKIMPDTIKVVWLDEPKITGTQDSESFAIQLSFQSYYPISLRTLIIFSDTKGEFYPILLTAVADNCSITNYIFIAMRNSKYRLIGEEWIREEESTTISKNLTKPKFSENMMIRKVQDLNRKNKAKTVYSNRSNQTVQYTPMVKVDVGPRLIVQMTKSMQRLTQLNFAFVKKHYEFRRKDSNFYVNSTSVFSHTDLLSDSTKSSLKTGKGLSDNATDVTYPLFPTGDDSYYEKFMTDTVRYMELWVYEVVFHCEAYLTIPTGFQMINSVDDLYRKTGAIEPKPEVNRKTIVDLIAELAGPTVRQYFSNKPVPSTEPDRIEYLFHLFYCLLNFLNIQGSFLPHVQPEYLFSYKDYMSFLLSNQACENMKYQGLALSVGNTYRRMNTSIGSGGSKSAEKDTEMMTNISSTTLNETWSKSVQEEHYEDDTEFRERKYVEPEECTNNVAVQQQQQQKQAPSIDYELIKEHLYKVDKMDEKEFNLRSTQAWLDVIIQIYRTLVLPKVVYRKFSNTGMLELEEKFSVDTLSSISYSASDVRKGNRTESVANLENYESNMYSIQERILLSWLDHHYHIQRSILWAGSHSCGTPPRKIDNFRTDLSDSLVLMAVTASHCPYLVPDYFVDVFATPENYEQIYHNAIKLTNAWKEVNIGLTVEPRDIVQSNPLFMLMVVCHLYEILPVLVPKSLIRFSAPLTQEVVRTIELVNQEQEKIVYEAKFIGTQEGSFSLVNSSTITLKPNKATEFKIAYRARRIHRVSVTLLLDGASISPHFAKSMVFQLEGEPSELTDSEVIRLNGTLYKVICLDIPIKPPYLEEATYEISYSTIPPNDPDFRLIGMKPWRELWNRKTSRRLFLNQSYLNYSGNVPAKLNVTIGCLTTDSRSFWLLFRSEVGDFIIRIDVPTTSKESVCGPISVTFPKTWRKDAQCTCSDVKRILAGVSGSSNCPLLCYLRVPARNNYLWNTMFVMFQKTLDSKEKAFWKKHFETNIGIRLIKWLLSQEESPESVDEFLPSLCTHVTYSVSLDTHSQKYIHTVPTLEINDVRKKEPVYLPIHISNSAPSDLKVTLTMTSGSKKEIRTIIYLFQEEKPSRDS